MVYRRLQLSIALLSASVLAYQLQLMHFLSLVQWHHFAFMVISVALLAFGAGGTILVIFRKFFEDHVQILLPLLMILSGFLMSIITRISRWPVFNFDSYRLFVESEQYLNLLSNYLLFFLPFLSAALAIGSVYMIYTRETGKYYFADLAGAGAGGPLAILLFLNFSPEKISPLIAFLPLIAAAFILKKKGRTLLISLILLVSAFNVVLLNKEFNLNPSEYKDISKTMLLPDIQTYKEENSPLGYLSVLSSPAMRYAPGLSVMFPSEVPHSITVFNNGNWYDAILPDNSAPGKNHIFDYTSMGLPYEFTEKPKVLVLGSGCGNEISQALKNDAAKVTGTEPDPALIKLMKIDFAQYSGKLFESEKAEVINNEPRTYLAGNEEKYDLIVIPLLGSFGGSTGLQAMQEENLLTIESFRQMWNTLSDKGMISVSCWLDYPVRYTYKTAATLAEALEMEGIDSLTQHIIAVQSWATVTFCAAKQSFGSKRLETLFAFADRMAFETIPGKDADIPAFSGVERQLKIDSVINILFTGNRENIYDDYSFKIRPANDNKPYFSQFLKWKSFRSYRQTMAEGTAAFLELGYMIIVVTFVQLFLLSILFILLPLFRLGWRGGKKDWVLVYFGALGLGFMFAEMVYIRYFTLYLGQPVYATAFVLSVLLVFSGTGSLFSSRLKANARTILFVSLLTFLLLIISAFSMKLLIEGAIAFNLLLRIFLAVLLIAPPSFLLGMSFPLGLRLLDEINQSAVPWAWGINASLSVISTALATIIAVEGGFRLVLIIAALCYLIAGLFSFRRI